ncbi:MAG: tetratricopeptide repeat protein [Phycisphaerales bacterium]|nr:tetratricopeptide repeat protein [Phycisphaerales bacterium]
MKLLITMLLACLLMLGCSKTSVSDLPAPPRPANQEVVQGEVLKAINQQLAAIEANPADLAARIQLAKIYQANELPGESIQTWQQIIQASPGEARQWYWLALAFEENGNYEEAISAAARSRELDSTIAPSYWRPAIWELDMGRPEKAEPLARESLRLDPNNAGGYVALARTLVALGRVEEAISILEQLRGMSAHPYILYLLGQAHQRAGNKNQADAYFANGEANQPEYPDPWNDEINDAAQGLDATMNRIDRHLERGELDQASAVIASGQETWPTDVNLIHRRSEVYRLRGNTSRWILELKKALRLDEENAATHLNLSIAYLQSKKQSLAFNHAVAAAKYNPLLPQAHLQVARLFLIQDNTDRAVLALDEAFRLGIQDPKERLHYAHVLLRTGRFQEAERHAQQVTTVDSSNPFAWGVLAETRHAQGNNLGAIEAVRNGIQVAPGHPALLQLQKRFSQTPTETGTAP